MREILLVSGTEHMGDFVELLGSGREHGCNLTYRVQDEAGGIAQALGLAELFCQNARSLVILGDNIFLDSLHDLAAAADLQPDHAWVALKQVPDPQRYGVAELRGNQVIGIEEKPPEPKSDFAVAGIYIYPPDVFEVIRTLKPSKRGELEITDVNNYYLRAGPARLQHPARLLDRRRHPGIARSCQPPGARANAALLVLPGRRPCPPCRPQLVRSPSFSWTISRSSARRCAACLPARATSCCIPALIQPRPSKRRAQVTPTVILQDLVMPEIDGLTLVKFFRANLSTRDVPLIVLSSKEEPVVKAQAFGLGANDYLVKLPDKIELIARIRYHSQAYIHLLERNEAYQKLEASQKQLAEEIARAASYVSSLLPPPLEGETRTDWRFVPSTALGGDVFGYHWLDADHLALFLLDVCGHGVGAALMAVSALNVLSSRTLPATDFRDPGMVLKGLNESFQMEKHNSQYFTIWYGVYSRLDHCLRHAGGGHPAALLFTGPMPGRRPCGSLPAKGLPSASGPTITSSPRFARWTALPASIFTATAPSRLPGPTAPCGRSRNSSST